MSNDRNWSQNPEVRRRSTINLPDSTANFHLRPEAGRQGIVQATAGVASKTDILHTRQAADISSATAAHCARRTQRTKGGVEVLERALLLVSRQAGKSAVRRHRITRRTYRRPRGVKLPIPPCWRERLRTVGSTARAVSFRDPIRSFAFPRSGHSTLGRIRPSGALWRATPVTLTFSYGHDLCRQSLLFGHATGMQPAGVPQAAARKRSGKLKDRCPWGSGLSYVALVTIKTAPCAIEALIRFALICA